MCQELRWRATEEDSCQLLYIACVHTYAYQFSHGTHTCTQKRHALCLFCREMLYVCVCGGVDPDTLPRCVPSEMSMTSGLSLSLAEPSSTKASVLSRQLAFAPSPDSSPATPSTRPWLGRAGMGSDCVCTHVDLGAEKRTGALLYELCYHQFTVTSANSSIFPGPWFPLVIKYGVNCPP